jgi:hypothetical protein
MANTSWVNIMHSLPDDLLTPAEKGQVCYHVIVEETIAEKRLQRAAEALYRLPYQTRSEQKATASFFKLVIAAATEPAGMCHIVDSHHCSILALDNMHAHA